MTTWDALVCVFNWLEAHTTRIIALSLGIITTLVGTDIIPEHQLKYYAATISVLTYLRGQSVSNTVATAKAIVKQNQSDPSLTQVPEQP